MISLALELCPNDRRDWCADADQDEILFVGGISGAFTNNQPIIVRPFVPEIVPMLGISGAPPPPRYFHSTGLVRNRYMVRTASTTWQSVCCADQVCRDAGVKTIVGDKCINMINGACIP